MVRLAVEAQALSALLLLLAQSQHAAVDAGDVGAAFKWADFEGTMQMALQALQAQLRALPQSLGTLGTNSAAGTGAGGGTEGQAECGAAGGAAIEAVPAARAAGSEPGDVTPGGGGSSEEEGELPPPLPDAAEQPQPAAAPAGHAPLPGAAPPLPDAAPPTAASLPEAPPLPHPAALPQEATPPPYEAAAPLFPAAAPPLPEGAAPLLAGAAAEQGLEAEAAAMAEPRKRRAVTEAAATAAGSKKARASAAPPAAPAGGSRRLAKGAASLINKWQAVAKQVEEEEEAAAAAAAALEDPEARAAVLEAQRRREAEEWRLQQLRTGAADDNANFAVREGRGCRPGVCTERHVLLSRQRRWCVHMLLALALNRQTGVVWQSQGQRQGTRQAASLGGLLCRRSCRCPSLLCCHAFCRLRLLCRHNNPAAHYLRACSHSPTSKCSLWWATGESA